MKPHERSGLLLSLFKMIPVSLNILIIIVLASNLNSCTEDDFDTVRNEITDTLQNGGDNPDDTIPPGGLATAAYYVSTDGNDNNPGTLEKPWASWQKAFSMASAGDTVYIRGGTYYAHSEDAYGVYAYRKRGSEAYPICFYNYPGETPVLDCSTITSLHSNHGILLYRCAYIHLKGLTVTGVSQHARSMGALGFAFEEGGPFTVEECVSRGNQGAGFWGYDVDEIYLINCDAYDNFDAYTSGYSGGQADGFVFCYASHSAYTYLKGCRSWYNSDDGFDTWENEGVVVFEDCWAFNNGRADGDGNGFKLGGTSETPLSEPQRILRNCMAFNNRFMGFNQNNGNVQMVLYNNIAYDNDLLGYEFVQYSNPIIVRNNISYRNGTADDFSRYVTHDHNSWDASPTITLTDADFISLDQNGASGARQSDGSLPETGFLEPTFGSDLIDAGTDVGIPYNGTAPDLGPFEKE